MAHPLEDLATEVHVINSSHSTVLTKHEQAVLARAEKVLLGAISVLGAAEEAQENLIEALNTAEAEWVR
jgi:hypothetical protein